METIFLVLTFVMIIPLAGYIVFGYETMKRNTYYYKWTTVCAVALFIISSIRLIFAIYLQKDNMVFYWVLPPIWLISSIFNWLSYKKLFHNNS